MMPKITLEDLRALKRKAKHAGINPKEIQAGYNLEHDVKMVKRIYARELAFPRNLFIQAPKGHMNLCTPEEMRQDLLPSDSRTTQKSIMDKLLM